MVFDDLKFRYPWRPYQQRVLQAIEQHMDDKRLHVVAAPGAGKTTLGLEVFRMLRRHTLVLSPTRVIRDQWIDRLKDFYSVEDVNKINWVSKSIDQPGIFTSITYQALHAKFSDELSAEVEEDEKEEALLEVDESVSDEELNDFIKALKQHDIGVIILDEAHHLRAEWWRALDKVCRSLPDLILVSLTATPPYDARDHEWIKYEQLCGPIDEEISVPELVKAGTLCAHQDFIWSVNATTSEKKSIAEYDKRVSTVCNTLFNDVQFNQIVLAHPWLQDDINETDIITEPQIAIAILAFLKARKLPIKKSLLSLLDLEEKDIPELGRRWWQVLVEALLFSSTSKYSESHQVFIAQLKKQLKASELLHKRELSLERSRRLERSLSLSTAKAQSCVAIHKLEYKHRGDSLRQVILTDYIRDEALKSGLETGEINLGAWPIFKALTTVSPIADQIGLLTGRLSIIPTQYLEVFFEFVDRTQFKVETMGNQGQYQKLIGPLNQLTTGFTALLMNGTLKTLVGTRSLLGEGWDAPAINSLILASSVGSFMLTNQMRGRAIRIDKKYPGKISSIWHLVAINSESYAGWSDVYDLRQRFNTFVGLSEKDKTIESGFDRMNLAVLKPQSQILNIDPVKTSNWLNLRRYRKLAGLDERWQDALTLDEAARVIPSVKTPGSPLLRNYILKHTLVYLLIQLIAVIASVFIYALSQNPTLSQHLILVLLFSIVAGLIFKLPKTITALRILFLHLPVAGSLKQIGKALKMALCESGLIETSFRRTKVNVVKFSDGSFYLSLSGCTFYESSLFADCLAEILAPIESPRYLVLRRGTFLGMTRDDYHAVPMKLAVKKDLAQIFYKSWRKYVGPSELIYTRNHEGKAMLLKARMKSFSSAFENEIKRQDRWQ
ncbi:MAG TPA: DEAD/DEAH box helicase family protein [Gammaproteobacteria bacterium]